MIFCCLGASIRVVMLLRDVKTQVKKRKCCIREEEKILKDLEDLEAPALGLWIPALRPAPPVRCGWSFFQKIQFTKKYI